MKLSKILASAGENTSVTIEPINGGYEVYSYPKTKRKSGKPFKVFAEQIIEDVELPKVSNRNVAHLGYNTYHYLELPNFYINFYKL